MAKVDANKSFLVRMFAGSSSLGFVGEGFGDTAYYGLLTMKQLHPASFVVVAVLLMSTESPSSVMLSFTDSDSDCSDGLSRLGLVDPWTLAQGWSSRSSHTLPLCFWLHSSLT